MSPPTWQQMPRSTGTSRICCSVEFTTSPSTKRNRESRITPFERREVGRRAGERRVTLIDIRRRRVVDGCVERRRVVQVDPVVALAVESGRQRDALQSLFVVLIDVDRAGHAVETGLGVVVPDRAATRRMQDAAVREHGEVHRLAGAVVEGHLLETAVRGRRRGRRGRWACCHRGDGENAYDHAGCQRL